MANDGLRVLGIAKAAYQHPRLPAKQHDFPFQFLGLVGLADPVRPSVPAAMEECRKAGVRVVMITGDYPGTAQSIARQIGLTSPDKVITGPELEELDDLKLRERIKKVNIFARILPRQKLRLVEAFKAQGEVVAMTGDGVNDAAALKAAHIGIAMGGRGTDVAREAASAVAPQGRTRLRPGHPIPAPARRSRRSGFPSPVPTRRAVAQISCRVVACEVSLLGRGIFV